MKKLPSIVATLIVLLLVGCTERRQGSESGGEGTSAASQPSSASDSGPVEITLGAYTTPREAYAEILPLFAQANAERGGPTLVFNESYLGSGAQARAIIGGFEADIAALSLAPDIEAIEEAGLMTHDWESTEHGGIVTRSIAVIGVRPGNPKSIRDWSDLARPDVDVLTPNVRTSGGAMWNVLAVYGAAVRAHAGDSAAGDAAAVDLLAAILRRVKIMDRGARDSMLTFERGVGDAIITYENEILVAQARGEAYEYVVPPSTILIENPVALIDASVDDHGNREYAQQLLDFLFTPEAQHVYARHGLRSVLDEVADATRERFAAVEDPFTIRDLGGWTEAREHVFAEGGIYDQALLQSREDAE